MFDMSSLPIVFAVALIKFMLGWVWYTHLFSAQWQEAMRQSGKVIQKEGALQAMAYNFITALLASFVLCHLVQKIGITTPLYGALLGFLCWLGFVVGAQIDAVLFEKQDKRLFLINTSYQLVALVLMGAALGLWH